jgi:hypothetical protein
MSDADKEKPILCPGWAEQGWVDCRGGRMLPAEMNPEIVEIEVNGKRRSALASWFSLEYSAKLIKSEGQAIDPVIFWDSLKWEIAEDIEISVDQEMLRFQEGDFIPKEWVVAWFKVSEPTKVKTDSNISQKTDQEKTPLYEVNIAGFEFNLEIRKKAELDKLIKFLQDNGLIYKIKKC